eukprot:3074233-Amphidinium_carterae.3
MHCHPEVAQKTGADITEVAQKTGADITETEIAELLAKQDQKSLDELATTHGVRLYHATINAGTILYLPIGVFVASCSSFAWGYRCSCLGAPRETLGENKAKESLQWLLDWADLKRSKKAEGQADWFFARHALDAIVKSEGPTSD